MDYEKAWKELKEDLWEDANKEHWMGNVFDIRDIQFIFHNPAQVFHERMAKIEDDAKLRSIK